MTQADLCTKAKISKSSLSEYISGKYEPKQDKIFMLSQALNVDPVWLMGYDVPMEKKEDQEIKKDSPTELQLSEGEKVLLDLFNRVPKDQQQLVLQMIRAALGSQE
jgi:transcriptional regulator with XRE-family HTH domain